MILYFSGTGNTKYVAERISAACSEKIISINDKLKANDTSEIHVDGKLIFVLPTYAWRIPKVVEHWINETDFVGVSGVWFVMTCGGEIGNAEKYILALTEQKGWRYMGTASVKLPDNYIVMFDEVKSDEAEKLFNEAEPKIKNIIEKINDKNSFDKPRNNVYDRLMSGAVNPLFYRSLKHKKFSANEKCISCGKCEKLCPLNNISIVDGKPVWGDGCTHCMACLSYCPVTAIECGNKTVGKERYRCERKCSE